MCIKVEKTTDYSKFKFLEQNREITDQRVNKISKSIEKVGYILSPILVNEKFEIIDGQGRFLALQKLGLPQYYIMQSGLGIEECRQMNIHQTNWSLMDYIKSYAKSGNENYIRLLDLINGSALRYGTVIMIARRAKTVGGSAGSIIKSGDFKMTAEEKEQARWELWYVEKFLDTAKRIGGRHEYFYMALAYAYRNLNTKQRNRLEEVVKKNAYGFSSFNSITEYLKYFDGYYNEGKRKSSTKINLEMQYRMDVL